MGLSKTASNILKGGASALGVAAFFTPVGAMCGLGGAAALGVDLVAGGAISKLVGKGVSGFKSFIDSHTNKSKDSTTSDSDKKLTKKEKKAKKKQDKKDAKAEAKEAKSLGIGDRTSSLSKKIDNLEKEEDYSDGAVLSNQQRSVDSNRVGSYQNSNGRNIGPMLNQYTNNLSEASSVSNKNRERIALRFDLPSMDSKTTNATTTDLIR